MKLDQGIYNGEGKVNKDEDLIRQVCNLIATNASMSRNPYKCYITI